MQPVPPSTIPGPTVVHLPRPALRSAPPPTRTRHAAADDAADDVAPPVPTAKITVPEPPPDLVDRPGLRAALAEAPGVVLVCAPAGYGKSSLLADWVHADAGVDTAWVGVDRGDNDPRRLWAAVVAAAAGCPSVPASSRLHAPWDWRAAAGPEFLAELVHTLQSLPRPIRLVLDDLHELVDPEALRGVEMLLRNRPAGLQIVVSSRFDPPLALPRLRLAGGLWELRDDRLRFSVAEAATLLKRAGLRLDPAQVELLHQRTGGWAAGLRLASLAVAEAPDRDEFLTDFSGDERSIADYLAGEILARLPVDTLEFLRVISVSDPIPWQLAAELSGREDAGHLLDELEHTTGLITATGRHRDEYRVQALLRTYLSADLHRQGPTRAAALHTKAARWWADRERPVHALDHAVRSRDSALLPALLHRFATTLLLTGAHGTIRRALASVSAPAAATDPWLALTSALVTLEAGDAVGARHDLQRARRYLSADEPAGLTVLRSAAEQLLALRSGGPAGTAPRGKPATEPDLDALGRLGRGVALLRGRAEPGAVRAELDAALALARAHGFDHLGMQCLTLLGVAAGTEGDLRTMRAVSDLARSSAAAHGWENSAWATAATAMLAYTALLRAEPAEAETLAADGLGLGRAMPLPALRFALATVHGAAVFDIGDRARGLAELQQARWGIGDAPASRELVTAAAMLEFRAALLLKHSAATRTVQTWLADRTGHNAEGLLTRAWTYAAAGRHDHARALLRPVLDATTPPVLSHTMVDAWLLRTSLAVETGDRPGARTALRTALEIAEPLDALRPFAHAGDTVRDLLMRQHGSFGASEAFADRALAAGRSGPERSGSLLSARELTVLSMLPSPMSLDEIAADLIISVNTVKTHVRSIYNKLGVSSRRRAILTAREHGLLTTGARPA